MPATGRAETIEDGPVRSAVAHPPRAASSASADAFRFIGLSSFVGPGRLPRRPKVAGQSRLPPLFSSSRSPELASNPDPPALAALPNYSDLPLQLNP